MLKESVGSSQQESSEESGVQKVKDVGEKKVEQVADKVRGGVRDQIDTRVAQLGDQIVDGANTLRSVGDQLQQQDKDIPARFADKAAEQVERLGQYLKSCGGERLLHDVEELGRKKPLRIIGGGLTVGVALARVLKSSGSKRYSGLQQRRQQWHPSDAVREGGVVPNSSPDREKDPLLSGGGV